MVLTYNLIIMATRQDVETAIFAIENGGNNTATEVRDVLRIVLEYINSFPNNAKDLLESAKYNLEKSEFSKSTNELLSLIKEYPTSNEPKDRSQSKGEVAIVEIVEKVFEIIKEKRER